MMTFSCAHCGQVTTKPRRNPKFCSQSCGFAYQRGRARPQQAGVANGNWCGGRRYHAGYVMVRQPDHPRAHGGYVFEHILVVERAMGKPLPMTAQVHHVDESRANNVHGNLVACQDLAYHKLLHQRTAALNACGHADWRKCVECKQWAPVTELAIYGRTPIHRACNAARTRRKQIARHPRALEAAC